MGSILRVETIKLQWIMVWFLIILDAVINSLMGVLELNDLKQFFSPSWLTLYTYSAQFHSMFFYPLYCGIIASLLCAYEHRDGGWKILLSSPHPRQQIYYAKYILLILILGLDQLIFIVGYFVSGNIAGAPGEIPWSVVLSTGLGGWLGIFPLAALQLMLSIKIRNFGASLGMSICCVVPNIVITGFHSSIGAWFPFTIPYYIMMPQTASYAPRVEFYSLGLIVLFTFLAYLFGGRKMFVNRDWL
ncbi:ABC transporter permease [Paenibacillus polymyxa]|uniref:ABC transporter permease n=1 Tax=Paenibacillus polymyxa TaxID=1406 RepID=UPI002AB564B4|nr:ABC transporter permease [Paenibacillus polymyxa]MDY8023247.1 ABC transporter permease [Paenibacillus polymyxa]